MKRKLIKTGAMVLMAVSMFAATTGFKTLEKPQAAIEKPVISLSCGHEDNTVCGTHRTYIYGEWSEPTKVRTVTGYFSWYTVYERHRTVYVICTDCQRLISVYTERQERSYAMGAVPTEPWRFI